MAVIGQDVTLTRTKENRNLAYRWERTTVHIQMCAGTLKDGVPN